MLAVSSHLQIGVSYLDLEAPKPIFGSFVLQAACDSLPGVPSLPGTAGSHCDFYFWQVDGMCVGESRLLSSFFDVFIFGDIGVLFLLLFLFSSVWLTIIHR